MNLKDSIRSIPNFPKEGILFKDITSLLEDQDAFQNCVNQLIDESKKFSFNKIAAIESRGFIFASTLSYLLSKPFILIRKKNKLPSETLSIEYDLEYGSETIEIHKNSIQQNDKVLIVDDLIATGGSASASASLIELCKGIVSGFLFVIDLQELNGAKDLSNNGYKVSSLLKY